MMIEPVKLLDYRLRGGLFLLYFTQEREYRVSNTMIPWMAEKPYLFTSKDRKLARAFFDKECHNER